MTRPWRERPEGQLLGTLQLPPERHEELWPGWSVVLLYPASAVVTAAAAWVALALWRDTRVASVPRHTRRIRAAHRPPRTSGDLSAAIVRPRKRTAWCATTIIVLCMTSRTLPISHVLPHKPRKQCS